MTQRPTRRQARYESPGVIDFPWDDDPGSDDGPRSDASCTIPWRTDGVEAIEVFLDPVLSDRVAEICSGLTTVAAAHDDIDELTDAIVEFADGGGLSVGIYDDLDDELSTGALAVAVTIG